MSHEVINLFPVLVMRFPNFLDVDRCDILVDRYQNSDILKKNDYFTNDALSTHSEEVYNIFDEITGSIEGFKDFSDRINNTLLEYSNISGFAATSVTQSWFNIQKRGSAILDHMHPLSYVSGCLYLSFPEGSNNIFFWNPNQLPNYINKREGTIYSSETYWIKPTKGDLLLFPGWVKHGSNGYENNSDNRSVIAFNSMPYRRQ